MRRKRPCRICRRWFVPHPRAGERQHVCSAADCQRERHRQACAHWRQREAEADRCHRLRQRLRVEAAGEAGGQSGLRPQIAWDAVRDAVGLEVRVVLEEILRLIEAAVRDAVARHAAEKTRILGREPGGGRRDDMVSVRAAP
jgi:hypothetical protein